MKRILLSLICVLLCLAFTGCSSDTSEPNDSDKNETSRFIKPLNDSEVFEHIGDENIKSDLRAALDGKITPNYVLKMLGKPTPDFSVEDYNGQQFFFGDDFFVLELVASWCEHCQAQAREYNKELLDTGTKIVQYFNADDKEGIDDYYEAVGESEISELPVTLIPHDDGLTSFIENEYQPLYYPTFIIFDGGQVVYATSGHLSIYDLARAQKVIDRRLDSKKLVDAKGVSIFDELMTYEDVESELGFKKCEALKAIDHDDNSYALTISNIGRVIDFENLHHFGGQYVNEVTDFKEMAEGDQIILAIGAEEENERLNGLVDSITKSDHETGVYVMTLGNTELSIHPGCKVFAGRAAIPVDLAMIDTASALTAIFIKDGVIAGIYSDPVDIDSVYELFLSENALVYRQ